METRTYNVYSFDELSEKAQQNALDNMRGWDTDHKWWDSIYSDAENVGIRIMEFDTGRGNRIKGEIMVLGGMAQVIALIYKEHGEVCETYKTAKEYEAKLEALNKEEPEDRESYEWQEWDEKRGILEEDFTEAILQDYLQLLREEYEHLQSDEYIKEIIDLNDYKFTSDGKIDY